MNKRNMAALLQQILRQGFVFVLPAAVLEKLRAFAKWLQFIGAHHDRGRQPVLPDRLAKLCWSFDLYPERGFVTAEQCALNRHIAVTSLKWNFD
jgi:hypothetical protein